MYLAIEGIDTAGKSTQLDILNQKYKEAIFIKEPGGTKLGSKIRSIVLEGEASSKLAEMFLFLADRSELIDTIIKPNLNKTLISDRTLISGIAYASFMNIQDVIHLNLLATQNILPSHTVLLTLSKEELINRLSLKENDSIELRGIEYLLDIQNRLEKTIKLLKLNHIIIDASLNIKDISNKIEVFINEGK
jgi:dTMP kinase